MLNLWNSSHIAMLATLRRDGSPRVSPIGPYLVLGHLLFGVMRSKKVHDLLRDPRCTLHSSVCDINGTEGEFKLYGRAVLVEDPQIRDGDYPAWWRSHPPAACHVFSMDIDSAAFVGWDLDASQYTVQKWSPDSGVSESKASYP